MLSASDPGRDSVRLQSKKTYTEHVTVWASRFRISWLSCLVSLIVLREP